MAAHPKLAPNDPPPDPVNETVVPEAKQTTDSLIQKILQSGPPWMRWTALILAALAPYAKYPVSFIQQLNLQHQVKGITPYPAVSGVPDESKTAPGTATELRKDSEDSTHIVWHHDVKNENPSWVAIYDNNENGLLAYKLFDSDGCLEIKRAKGSLSSTKLIRRLDSADPQLGSPSVLEQSPLAPGEGHGGWADSSGFAPRLQTARLMRTQVSCLNPHPGQFHYWYGTATDQCWVPMFRQFADSCTHYQMFNRCNGAYDAQIHWTQCVPKHFW